MYHYSIFGFNVLSDIKLDSAYESGLFSDQNADIIITNDIEDKRLLEETEEEKNSTGGFFYRYIKDRGWVRVPKQGAFLVEYGKYINYILKDGHNNEFVAEIILVFCFPLIIAQRREIVIHGSCISDKGRAFIISGDSGSGKSTLTETWLQNSGKFMSDDTVRLTIENEKIYAYPSFPQQKLTQEAVKKFKIGNENMFLISQGNEEDKYALRVKERFYNKKQELDTVIILKVDDGTTGKIEKITGNNKFKIITSNIFKLKRYVEMGFDKEIFNKIIVIVSKINIYQLSRPTEGLSPQEEYELIKSKIESIS